MKAESREMQTRLREDTLVSFPQTDSDSSTAGRKKVELLFFPRRVTTQYIYTSAVCPSQYAQLSCALRTELKQNREHVISLFQPMLKGINKCTEEENGHKHRGFYSECRDADESAQCTWRAAPRARRARRVIMRGQRAPATLRPRHHPSTQQLLDF